MTEPQFDKTFEPAHGEAVAVASDILRVTAPNAGPLTFHGTNSYIVGRDTLAVIDPGPENESHWRTLLAAIAGRPVSHIFVSHTHRDHSPLAARLKAETGATIVAEGPHRAARPLYTGEVNPLKESADMDFVPDIAAAHGHVVSGDGWSIETLHKPRQFVRALKTHRIMRERAVLGRIEKGDRLIADMVKAIYRDTDPRLHGAAALSVLAHLEDLVGRGEVVTDGPPSIKGEYRPA